MPQVVRDAGEGGGGQLRPERGPALTLGLGRARRLRHVLRARHGHLVRVGDETEPHLPA
jgi:hypothetical protein